MNKLSFVFMLLLAGCTVGEGPAPIADSGALQSRVAVALDTDVASVSLTATQVDCTTGVALPDGDVHTADASLLGARLADFELGIDTLSPASDHDFTDIFLLVDEGCYDLVAQPLDGAGDASTDCSMAVSDGAVEVLDGLTTEVLLLSTCEGQATGGLDTVIAFNEEPTITDFTYDGSTFTDVCAAPVTVCADATDPNRDAIEFTWDVGTASHAVLSHDQVDDISTECIEITPADDDDLTIAVAAYDLLADGSRIEDYFTSVDNAQDSHDTLEAPLHVSGTDTDGDGSFDCQDCDPADDTVNPGAAEVCGDGIDNNCDGQVDEACAPACPINSSIFVANILPEGTNAGACECAAPSVWTSVSPGYRQCQCADTDADGVCD